MLITLLTTLLIIFFLCVLPKTGFTQDEYSFDFSEIEKKPYHIGGSLEFRPVLLGLDREAAFYKLKFNDDIKGNTIREYNSKLELEVIYEWEKTGLFIKTNTDLVKSYTGWSDKTTIYEGYISIKPSFNLTIEIGKRQLKWGKGYAWSPVAYIDKDKNPDEPEIGLEGLFIARADYIKSFNGPLKTLSIMPVLLPVYEDINDDFGRTNHLNLAFKTYLLLYDTDIDLIVLTGGSKSGRYGLDFSGNIKTNLEIHGEFAYIKDSRSIYCDANGHMFERTHDSKSYLIGIRYLTDSDTTFILEFYHNGTGFSEQEMRDYLSFTDKSYETYLANGDDSLIKKALELAQGNYGKINPQKDYLYLRISQKEPFDILYLIPSLTFIYNPSDQSFSFSPELLYNPITNLELRLKLSLIEGKRHTEYGDKQNDYRIEFKSKYYF